MFHPLIFSFKKTPSPKIVDCGLRNGFGSNIAGIHIFILLSNVESVFGCAVKITLDINQIYDLMDRLQKLVTIIDREINR